MRNKELILVLVTFFLFLACNDERSSDWGTIDIPETGFSIELETRYNNGQLLYILRMTPYDDNLLRLANTVNVELLDREGFVLGRIEPEAWNRSNDSEGRRIGVISRGNIPMTRNNYRNLGRWSVSWRN